MTPARIQLAVGTAAVLADALAADGPRQLFAARAPHEAAGARPSRLVVVHPAPPSGPTSGALLDRMASIRAVQHPVLAAPLATGQVEDRAWVVEPAPSIATLAERLAAGALLPVHDAVRLLRDASRALSALHRRGLCHGALTAEVVTFDSGGARIYGLGRRIDGTAGEDLRALGSVVQQALHGDPADPEGMRRHRRHAVPPQLQDLLAALSGDDPTVRPASADAVLAALDWFPSVSVDRHRNLLDGLGRGSRPPAQRHAAILLAAVAVVLLLAWLLIGAR